MTKGSFGVQNERYILSVLNILVYLPNIVLMVFEAHSVVFQNFLDMPN